MIADSLKTVVAYDSLTIYRIDKERGVRRPVIARDRFAELILGYDAPLGTGLTGWAVDHREPVLANDAPPRHALGPDPGHAVRAGVDGHRPAHGRGRGAGHPEHRPDGRRRVPLQPERVRADEALRGPGGDRAPERRGARRGQGPGRARRAHRPPEPRLVPARAPGYLGAATDRPGRRADDGSRPVQGLQRPERPSGRRRAARRGQPGDRVVHPPGRPGVSLRRRRVRGHPARLRAPGGRGGRPPDPAAIEAIPDESGGRT